jgi:uncharacterized protein
MSQSYTARRMVRPEEVLSAEVAQLVRDFQRRLRERFGNQLREMRLFGSHARGTAREDSDIDVFVLLEQCDYSVQRDVLNIAGDLFFESNRLVSPTIFGRSQYEAHVAQQRALVTEIQQQGLPL